MLELYKRILCYKDEDDEFQRNNANSVQTLGLIIGLTFSCINISIWIWQRKTFEKLEIRFLIANEGLLVMPSSKKELVCVILWVISKLDQ